MPRAHIAGLAYIGVVFTAGIGLGTVHTLILAPWLGEARAVILELPIILAISLGTSKWLARQFAVPARASARLIMGTVAFACLTWAEAVLTFALLGRTTAEFPDSLATPAEWLGSSGQILFALFPLLQRG